MEPATKPEEAVEKRKNISGNKMLLIIISSWFLFYMYSSLNGSGG